MKYLVNFYDNDMWETNENCEHCKIINEYYTSLKKLNINEQQEILNLLDTYYLTDGYNLLFCMEKRGYNISNIKDIEKIKTYKTNTEAFMNEVYRLYDKEKYNPNVEGDIFHPTLLHSRWCKRCISRKPSIYNDERNINNAKY